MSGGGSRGRGVGGSRGRGVGTPGGRNIDMESLRIALYAPTDGLSLNMLALAIGRQIGRWPSDVRALAFVNEGDRIKVNCRDLRSVRDAESYIYPCTDEGLPAKIETSFPGRTTKVRSLLRTEDDVVWFISKQCVSQITNGTVASRGSSAGASADLRQSDPMDSGRGTVSSSQPERYDMGPNDGMGVLDERQLTLQELWLIINKAIEFWPADLRKGAFEWDDTGAVREQRLIMVDGVDPRTDPSVEDVRRRLTRICVLCDVRAEFISGFIYPAEGNLCPAMMELFFRRGEVDASADDMETDIGVEGVDRMVGKGDTSKPSGSVYMEVTTFRKAEDVVQEINDMYDRAISHKKMISDRQSYPSPSSVRDQPPVSRNHRLSHDPYIHFSDRVYSDMPQLLSIEQIWQTVETSISTWDAYFQFHGFALESGSGNIIGHIQVNCAKIIPHLGEFVRCVIYPSYRKADSGLHLDAYECARFVYTTYRRSSDTVSAGGLKSKFTDHVINLYSAYDVSRVCDLLCSRTEITSPLLAAMLRCGVSKCSSVDFCTVRVDLPGYDLIIDWWLGFGTVYRYDDAGGYRRLGEFTDKRSLFAILRQCSVMTRVLGVGPSISFGSKLEFTNAVVEPDSVRVYLAYYGVRAEWVDGAILVVLADGGRLHINSFLSFGTVALEASGVDPVRFDTSVGLDSILRTYGVELKASSTLELPGPSLGMGAGYLLLADGQSSIQLEPSMKEMDFPIIDDFHWLGFESNRLRGVYVCSFLEKYGAQFTFNKDIPNVVDVQLPDGGGFLNLHMYVTHGLVCTHRGGVRESIIVPSSNKFENSEQLYNILVRYGVKLKNPKFRSPPLPLTSSAIEMLSIDDVWKIVQSVTEAWPSEVACKAFLRLDRGALGVIEVNCAIHVHDGGMYNRCLFYGAEEVHPSGYDNVQQYECARFVYTSYHEPSDEIYDSNFSNGYTNHVVELYSTADVIWVCRELCVQRITHPMFAFLMYYGVNFKPSYSFLACVEIDLDGDISQLRISSLLTYGIVCPTTMSGHAAPAMRFESAQRLLEILEECGVIMKPDSSGLPPSLCLLPGPSFVSGVGVKSKRKREGGSEIFVGPYIDPYLSNRTRPSSIWTPSLDDLWILIHRTIFQWPNQVKWGGFVLHMDGITVLCPVIIPTAGLFHSCEFRIRTSLDSDTGESSSDILYFIYASRLDGSYQEHMVPLWSVEDLAWVCENLCVRQITVPLIDNINIRRGFRSNRLHGDCMAACLEKNVPCMKHEGSPTSIEIRDNTNVEYQYVVVLFVTHGLLFHQITDPDPRHKPLDPISSVIEFETGDQLFEVLRGYGMQWSGIDSSLELSDLYATLLVFRHLNFESHTPDSLMGDSVQNVPLLLSPGPPPPLTSKLRSVVRRLDRLLC